MYTFMIIYIYELVIINIAKNWLVVRYSNMFRIYLKNLDYMNDHFHEKNLSRIFRRIHTITVINF